MANIIEILLRAKDETKGAFASVRGGLGGIKSLIGGFAGALAIRGIIDEMKSAEEATFKLDQAFEATGKTVGKTRKELDDLATELQHTTTVSDGLVKTAESVLLTFTKVRGEAFERTIKVSNDLTARLGGDLTDAVRKVGTALQDPEKGMRSLRSAGISFSDSQKQVIQNLVATGQQAKAQDIILSALEKRYAGTAAAARNTLSGALTALKNQFGSLFEGSGDSSGPVKAINDLTTVLQSPALKEGISALISGMAKIAELGIRAGAGVGNFFGAIQDFLNRGGEPIDRLVTKITTLKVQIAELSKGSGGVELKGKIAELANLQVELDKMTGRGQNGRRGKFVAPIDEDREFVSSVKEVTVAAKRVSEDIPSFLQQMNDGTRTEVDKTVGEIYRLRAEVSALVDEGIIDQNEAGRRRAEQLDTILPEFDLSEIRAKLKPIKQELTELDEFTKGVWRGVGNSIRENLAQALYDGKISLRSFVDVARKAFADILAAIITSGIKKAILEQFSNSGSTSGSASGSTWGGVITGILALFGGSAAGGRSSKPRWVGEEGPELLTEPGQITNQRSLAAMGGMGGANVTFAPSYSYVVTEREDPQKTKQDMARYTETRLAQDRAEFVRVLRRSGVEVRG